MHENTLITKPLSKQAEENGKFIKYNKPLVNINSKEQQFEIFCQITKEWSVNNLNISNIREKSIIHKIIPIKFSHLFLLILENNKIQSIQNFSRLNANSLNEINLNFNKIISIRPLAAMLSKNLNRLSIRGNPILDFQSLSCLKAANLQSLTLEWERDPTITHGTKEFVKLQAIYLRNVYIESSRRMRKSNILHRKYPNIAIYLFGEDSSDEEWIYYC